MIDFSTVKEFYIGNNEVVGVSLNGTQVWQKQTGPSNDELWYTSTSGTVVTPTDSTAFNATIVSNTYSNGKGVIKFDNDLTSIGTGAFTNATGLTSVTFPSSLTTIQSESFNGCTGLTSIDIPDSVSVIQNGAFHTTPNVTSITVDANNPTYDSRDDCNAIINTSTNRLVCGCQNTVVPNTVVGIDAQAFQGCSTLASLTLPNSVTSYGNQCFFGCSALTSINIPSGVTSFSIQSFSGCSSLTSITIPTTVTTIGQQAFQNCSSLDSITIPYSVTRINQQSFAGCVGVMSITIGSRVNTIASNAFLGVTKGTTITVNSSNTTYDSRDNCNAIIKKSNNALVLGCKNTVIPNNVTSINGNAFYGCDELTSITIPSSVTSIGDLAFNGCTALTSITSLATTAPTIQGTTFYGVGSNGTLYAPYGRDYSTWMSNGDYYLGKYNWTCSYFGQETPFYVENPSSSSFNVTISKNNTSAPTLTVEYSTDKTNWTSVSTASGQTIQVPANGRLYLRSNTNSWASSSNPYYYNKIDFTGNGNVGGNIMSLIYGSDFTGNETSFRNSTTNIFVSLFINNTHLISAEKLILPCTTLVKSCYMSMFNSCTKMTTAPLISATTLATDCFNNMFRGCTLLNTIEVKFTSWLSGATPTWVYGVSATGKFTKPSALPSTIGTSNIPSGWTIVDV